MPKKPDAKKARELRLEQLSRNLRKIGDEMLDGSIYAGVSSTGKDMFVTARDLPLTMSFNNAARFVEGLNEKKEHSHDDWRIPSLADLEILRENKNKGALMSTFKMAIGSGANLPGWYWSSTPYDKAPDYIWCARFIDTAETANHKDLPRLSCRPVRFEEKPKTSAKSVKR